MHHVAYGAILCSLFCSFGTMIWRNKRPRTLTSEIALGTNAQSQAIVRRGIGLSKVGWWQWLSEAHRRRRDTSPQNSEEVKFPAVCLPRREVGRRPVLHIKSPLAVWIVPCPLFMSENAIRYRTRCWQNVRVNRINLGEAPIHWHFLRPLHYSSPSTHTSLSYLSVYPISLYLNNKG